MMIRRSKTLLFLQRLSFVLAAVFMLVFGSIGTKVFADSPCSPDMSAIDCDSLVGNWVNWKAEVSTGGACTGGGTLTGSDDEEKIWNFLTGKGLSAEQAAGVMGNIAVESAHTWSPAVHQTTADPWNTAYGNGFGIAQWDGTRRYDPPSGGILGSMRKNQPNLVQYIDPSYDPRNTPKKAIPQTDEDTMLAFELNFLYQEGNSRIAQSSGFPQGKSEWNVLKTINNIDDATVFWHNDFEVSSDTPQEVLQNRGGDAHDVYNKYGGKSGSGGTSSDSSCADTSGITATVLAYAWPTYHPPTYMDEKPAYSAAIDKSLSNGMYTGNDHGIDCGAFVTTLMIYSGFEPKYNYSGKIANGAGNTSAQKQWLDANWQHLGPATSINVADLQPGDVAISGDHTYVWVGTISGFGAKIASASTGAGYQRSPMADTAQVPTEAGFDWYRKK